MDFFAVFGSGTSCSHYLFVARVCAYLAKVMMIAGCHRGRRPPVSSNPFRASSAATGDVLPSACSRVSFHLPSESEVIAVKVLREG